MVKSSQNWVRPPLAESFILAAPEIAETWSETVLNKTIKTIRHSENKYVMQLMLSENEVEAAVQ